MLGNRKLEDFKYDGSRTVPKYEQLYRLLLDALLAMPPEQQYLPYQYELCAHFHLSKNTVTRALQKLQKRGYVENTRNNGSRILSRSVDAVRPVRYAPGFHECVGLIFANSEDDPHLRHDYRWDIIDEIERLFATSGVRMVLYNLREDNYAKWSDPETLISSLQANRIRQVIFLSSILVIETRACLRDRLLQAGFRMILFEWSLKNLDWCADWLLPRVSAIAVNHVVTLWRAVPEICRRGERILYLSNPYFDGEFSRERAKVLSEIARAHNLEFDYIVSPFGARYDSPYGENPQLTLETARQVEARCVETPTVVFCANDIVAMSLFKLLKKVNFRVIGYDNSVFSRKWIFPTFGFNVCAIAAAALRLYSEPGAEDRILVVNSRFVDRTPDAQKR